MKLNLHVPFKAWNGEEIKERKGEEEKAKMIDCLLYTSPSPRD